MNCLISQSSDEETKNTHKLLNIRFVTDISIIYLGNLSDVSAKRQSRDRRRRREIAPDLQTFITKFIYTQY